MGVDRYTQTNKTSSKPHLGWMASLYLRFYNRLHDAWVSFEDSLIAWYKATFQNTVNPVTGVPFIGPRMKRKSSLFDDFYIGAYRDQIDYRSFGAKGPLTEKTKDYIIEQNYAAILKAIKEDVAQKEDFRYKTFLHYFGYFCVYLVALASGLSIAAAVTGNISFGGSLGTRFLNVFITFAGSWANVVIFRKAVPRTAKRIAYKDIDNGWHLLRKDDLMIRKDGENVRAQYPSKNEDGFTTYSDNRAQVSFDSTTKAKIIFLSVCTLVVSLGACAYVILATPATLSKMPVLGAMTAAFGPIAWILGIASLVCSLTGVIFSIVRYYSSNESKTMKIFDPMQDKDGKILWSNVAANVAVGVTLMVAVGLGIWGLGTTALTHTRSLLEWLHLPAATAPMVMLVAAHVSGKFLFSIRAVVHFVKLLPYFFVGCAKLAARPFIKLFNKVKDFCGEPRTPITHSRILSEDSPDRIGAFDLGMIGVNASSNGFVAADGVQNLSFVRSHLQYDDQHNLVESPLYSSNPLVAAFAWVATIGGATVSAAAAFDKLEPEKRKAPIASM